MADPIIVLLIDDQPMIGEAVRRMLASETEIAFHYCNNPTQALKMATDCHPTVILQDLVMPEIDGLLLVKFLRTKNSLTRDVPLIVLSTKEDPVIKAKAFELGANDYLVKLPDSRELIARIRYHSKAYMDGLKRQEAEAQLKAENIRQAQYIEQVDKVTNAAVDVEKDNYQPESLTDVAARSDALGQLARVFQRMAKEIYQREKRLKQQIQELRIEIDQSKKARQVAEITETDYFQQLQVKAKNLRNKSSKAEDVNP
ncbi:response regulator [Neosynechococcus sphagnicola]|uniref:response regulator n=1 Tax=Neosynechococcus sphagnicola TaxID=1501145 RepID=UPI0009DF8567|nr:response regulator [Neosynechococcus sphagnicola]